jgi:hypothetical protein
MQVTCEHRINSDDGMCEACEAALKDNEMVFGVALELLKQGVKMTRLSWLNDSYLELHQDRLRWSCGGDCFYWHSTDEDILAKDWVLVAEEGDL